MNNTSIKTKKIVYAALIAALYAGLTIANAGFGYGTIQFRISEALTILPFFSSFSILGLTVGCFASNLISPMPLDIILGVLATLLAAITTYKIGKSSLKYKRYLAPLPAVIINGIIIGLLINLSLPSGPITSSIVGISLNTKELIPTMFIIAFEEMIPCYAIGLPLLILIEKNHKLKKLFDL